MSKEEIQRIYEAYSQDVMNVAFFYSSSREDAEDATMDVFAELIRNEPKNLSNIKSYLLKSAMGKAIDIDRRNAKAAHGELLDEDVPSDSGEGSERSLDVSLVRGPISNLSTKKWSFGYGAKSKKDIYDSYVNIYGSKSPIGTVYYTSDLLSGE